MLYGLPLVSVIIPCYNHEDYIEQCVLSVIDQSYQDIELIIIDDGSTDQSFARIQALQQRCEERFINFIFMTRENMGLCQTLNQALALCCGEYVSVIASDDVMLKNKIALQISYALKHPDVCSIYGGVRYIDQEGNLAEYVDLELKEYQFEQIFLHKCILYAPTQMHKLKDLQELGGFDPDVKIEDWDLLLKLAFSKKRIVCIPEQLAYYRQHANNTSNDSDFMMHELLKIAEKYQHHPKYKQARFRIIKQYKLNSLKQISKSKYYLSKLWYRFRS